MLKANRPDEDLLNLRRLPILVDAKGASQLIGVPLHEISTLTSAGLLPVLGKPAKNAIKYYSTEQVLELAAEEKWLTRAVMCIYRHHQERNGKVMERGIKEVAA